MANEVFISYSRRNYGQVYKIKEEIDRKVGIDCWMDINGIESGEQFLEVIISAINRHDTFLFMLSKESMQSEWALDELDLAKKNKKRVILVNIDSSEMTDKFFFKYHKYDNILWSDPLQHDKLLRNLKAWFHKEKEIVRKVQKPTITVHNKSFKVDDEKAEILAKITQALIRKSKSNGPQVHLHPMNGDKCSYLVGPEGNAIMKLEGMTFEYENFNEGMACVFDNNTWKYGFINSSGKIVIKPRWEEPSSFSEGLAAVKSENELWGYIDRTGKILIPAIWEYAGGFGDGLAPVYSYYVEDGGYIDKRGCLVIPDRWYSHGKFSEGLAHVQERKKGLGGKWGYINIKGQEVIPYKWKEAGLFHDGLAPVKNNKGEWGYIDRKGNVRIPFTYKWKQVGGFGNGLAPVMNWDEQWGFIDRKGILVFPFQWFGAERFHDGMAWVKTTNQWKLIDRKGQYVKELR